MRLNIFITLSFCFWLEGHGQPLPAHHIQVFDQLIDQYQLKHHFSGVVLVARRNQVIYSSVRGFADQNRGIVNTLDTPFLIGSTTKSFTAITILQLVDAGVLDLHSPIGEYLPELREDLGNQLTLHWLLRMSSGLPGHLNQVTELSYKDLEPHELLHHINNCSLTFKPGTQYAYSNLNYQLAALIATRVSGKLMETLLAEQTFQPLNMQQSGSGRTQQVPAELALGHNYDSAANQVELATQNYLGHAIGSGDIYSTASDLFRWDQALYYSQAYLSPSSNALLLSGNEDSYGGYGYGFRTRRYVGEDIHDTGKLVRHGGSMLGYLANINRYLDDELTIIVLTNIRPFPIQDLTFDIKEIYFGRAPGRANKSYVY